MNLPIGRESGGQRLLSLKAESCKQRFDFNVNVFSSIIFIHNYLYYVLNAEYIQYNSIVYLSV